MEKCIKIKLQLVDVKKSIICLVPSYNGVRGNEEKDKLVFHPINTQIRFIKSNLKVSNKKNMLKQRN